MKWFGGGRTLTLKDGSLVEPLHGQPVNHCNKRTGYELVNHGYRPGRCTECDRIAATWGPDDVER